MKTSTNAIARLSCFALAVVISVGCSEAAAATCAPASFAGLYVSHAKRLSYAAFWRDGSYYLGKPAFRVDGTLDHAASIAGRPDSSHGKYRLEDRGPDVCAVTLTSAAGGSETYGLWYMRGIGTQNRPSSPALLGTFYGSSSHAIGDFQAASGTIDTSLLLGSSTDIVFLPGRKFALKRETYAAAVTTRGDGAPSRAGNFADRDAAATSGTYEIKGYVLRLKLGDGKVIEDLVTFLEADPKLDIRFKIVWGNRVLKQITEG